MSKKEEIISILDQYPQYRETLFRRGYLITTSNDLSLDAYPFYGHWNKTMFGELKDGQDVHVYYHKLQDYHSVNENSFNIAMIGHAYNPFNMKYQEQEILKDLLYSYKVSEEDFFDKASELTGVHLIILNDKQRLIIVQDCSGMKSCYFGKINSEIYVTSHPQLVGDINDLKTDPFVKKLVNSRCYNIGNRYLPGNITPFEELKRLGGNTYLEYKEKFMIKRFYPLKANDNIHSAEHFSKGIKQITEIMFRNIELTTKKWKRLSISLSGGIDSKTTLACANGLYDQFKYFSFYCKPQEEVDANAASEICHKLGLTHDIYEIASNSELFEDFNVLKRIIDHNTSYFMNIADHEVRKMVYLYWLTDFEVELKSWVSETTRVFLERKYRVKMPEVLNERHFSIFQTRYFMDSELLIESDRRYKRFMKEIGLDKSIYNFDHSDLFYWEVRMGAWGTAVFASLDFCHNVTIPYNNRKLIELFLKLPKEDRKSDKIHKSVIKLANKDIYDMHLEIKNLYFHFYRIWLEKGYYFYRTMFYKSK